MIAVVECVAWTGIAAGIAWFLAEARSVRSRWWR